MKLGLLKQVCRPKLHIFRKTSALILFPATGSTFIQNIRGSNKSNYLCTRSKGWLLKLNNKAVFRIWIQHFFQLNTDPDLGFWWPKIVKIYTWKKRETFFLKSKTTIYLSPGLHKGSPSYRRSFQPSKGTSSTSKQEIFNFFYFCGSFLPSWIQIRIRRLQ